VPRFAYLDHPGPIPFAHRGGAGEWPENTMPAFAGAVALGYRYVETDVHATADGVLLAFHDDVLDRVTDRTGVIAELSYAEVAGARVDGREAIPRFEDLLGAWPDLRVNVDPKHDRAVAPLIAAIRRTGALDRVGIGSFSDRRLQQLRAALGPRLCVALGPRGTSALRAASMGVPGSGRLVDRWGAGCAQVPTHHGRIRIIDRRFVRAAHRLDIAVHVWTIDDAAEMRRLLDLGVDGIMTDHPAVLKQVLTERGAWVD
jgi:glycerophosphoryl diester phosphodiesterase